MKVFAVFLRLLGSSERYLPQNRITFAFWKRFHAFGRNFVRICSRCCPGLWGGSGTRCAQSASKSSAADKISGETVSSSTRESRCSADADTYASTAACSTEKVFSRAQSRPIVGRGQSRWLAKQSASRSMFGSSPRCSRRCPSSCASVNRRRAGLPPSR
nr:MAG TPA: hypothetical protein [Caudoviricetes sp.]